MVILLVPTLKIVLLLAAVWTVRTAELITVEGYEGGKAEIRCPYKEEWRSQQKYLCKGDCPVFNKDKVIKTEEGENSASKGRYSMKDIREESVFIVTITNLTLKDAGRYWCGVDKWGQDNYIKVNLEVSEAPTITTKTEPTTTASNPDSPTPSSLATTISPSSISSTHNGSGISVIIIVSMSLVTLLLVVSLLIVYRWKCNKETAVSSALTVNTGINREGCDGVYEEINDRPLESIYANLPTIPSES
ncbi:CMRF35-like molecule 9 isoform X2 [Salmo salar]|uniref:CMRF35-like molecule 9 isoform X2 n=1 Tax=Salmo salar TaxID=8030 RepID=A0A1S3R0H2_SALSA|nr:CMRF35-like molecule 9 isoform X2 [Salmo salar]|eukprot:XP_014045367.1 PREDICTED: CMRF35-like molecule 9 isoform X2 [Salmo salar]